MIKNSYSFAVGNTKLDNFEFIAGPMAAVSIPHPPREPEEFIKGCFEGGATPIMAPRDTTLSNYMDDIKTIKKRMPDSYIGANIFAPWRIAPEFLEKLNELKPKKNESPDFVDINAIELNFEGVMPLLKEIQVPIYLGINQPASVYTLRKYLKQKEYSFLIDRIKTGLLKVYLPQNHGGGHLPILKKEQEGEAWTVNLLKELIDIGNEIGCPIPFIVEKGMLTIEDFISVIEEYSEYPSFTGVRFASVLELTKESALNTKAKEFLKDIIMNQRREMIIPIRSVIGAAKAANNKTVRGGVISYVVATELAKKIHSVQCADEDFPKFSRKYSDEALFTPVENGKQCKKRYACTKCIPKCPREYCEIGGALESVLPEGDLNAALVHITPDIFDIDRNYINAPVAHVVKDIINKVLSHFNEKAS